MNDNHNPRIQLTDDVGILMSYPNLATVLSMKQDNEKEGNVDAMFQMMQDCMYQIWQGEETFDTTDYSDKDKQEFLDSLNHEQFEKLQAFFETMPTLKHEVEVTNPKTQVKSKVVLEGMNSFFS